MIDHEGILRKAAAEIRAANINGWGNACEGGADRIRVLEAALGKIIERADKGRHEEDFDSIRILASDAYAYAPPQAETGEKP